jgi:hypothetical protein
MRIIELANIVAGPSVGKYLSDFGAEVIKVERPGDGDSTRTMGVSLGGRSAWWLVLGRNKKTITLDLSNPDGRDVLLRLVRDADALVESFRASLQTFFSLRILGSSLCASPASGRPAPMLTVPASERLPKRIPVTRR